jgi:hypothetical protein
MDRAARRQFLEAVQTKVARIAVSSTIVRGISAGAVAEARMFCREVDLARIGSARSGFRKLLDRTTDSLLAALPDEAQHWGVARKLLNIFLRDCFYTTYLNEAFDLGRSESAYELPLDSMAALHLARAAGRFRLPAWPGVKHVTPPMHAEFQVAAAEEAERRGIARVHLDAVWWSQGREDDAAT